MRSFLFLLASTYALSPLVIKGNKFFQKDTGKQFFFKGVCYQPRGTKSSADFNDPLKDAAACKRDVAMFKELGVNTVRVYEVDPSANHDDCMKMLEEAGIYLALDLPAPKFSINRKNPTYDLDILNHYKANVDAFMKYKNIAVFFAGNEINNDKTNTDANPFVKAGLRDIKAYIKAKGGSIPVGYANNDDTATRQNIMNYFNCGKDDSERADFYAINVYAWCNAASFQKSGYPELTKELKGLSIPAFFSEFGCNTNGPREFVKEVAAMFGPDMNEVFSGGLMYEYSEEDNKYGVATISGTSVKPKAPEFDNLKKAYAAVSPPSDDIKAFSPANTGPSQCPAESGSWMASDKLPPTPSTNACECMVKKLECVVNPKVLDVAKSTEVGDIFSYLCDNGADCTKYLSVNGTTGDYGSFSGCTTEQKLSWALNAAYLKSGKNADSCKDNAMTQKAESGKIDDCASLKTDITSGGKSSAASHPKAALHLSVLLALSALAFSS